jgi:hypothetical protein
MIGNCCLMCGGDHGGLPCDQPLTAPNLTSGETTMVTSQLCFVAGKLHQRVWNMTTGAAPWVPVQSFETIEEADCA